VKTGDIRELCALLLDPFVEEAGGSAVEVVEGGRGEGVEGVFVGRGVGRVVHGREREKEKKTRFI
jgi:hypothetical protein